MQRAADEGRHTPLWERSLETVYISLYLSLYRLHTCGGAAQMHLMRLLLMRLHRCPEFRVTENAKHSQTPVQSTLSLRFQPQYWIIPEGHQLLFYV